MITIFDVAKWFLNKTDMEQKKLQKLCYYAQSWSLALLNKPLFDQEFEAWVHGPVNRSIWNRFRDKGYLDISASEISDGNIDNIDHQTSAFLESVWNTYGDFTGYQLELLSHKEQPWIEARGTLPESAPSSRTINPATMKSYYRSLLSGDGIGE